MSTSKDFSLDGMREFLLSKKGRVNNNELVKHYKAQLTDPGKKAENKEKFKEYITILCSIQVEQEEKVMVLKTRFYDTNLSAKEIKERHKSSHQGSSSSLLEPNRAETKKSKDGKKSSGKGRGALASLVMQAGIGRSPATELERRAKSETPVRTDSTDNVIPADVNKPKPKPSVPMAVADQLAPLKSKQDEDAPKLSVIQLANQMNKMSESDLLASSEAADRRRRHNVKQAEKENSGEDLSYLTVHDYERKWMILASTSDYHPMAKLLNSHPYLALRKDFTSGYTALHWAAKHGKLDVIKLLAGHNADMNARSHGGYTALHLAAMHGFEEIIEVLVRAYNANPNIRDYAGKKAKQYLANKAGQRTHLVLTQMLSNRKLSTVHATSSITAGLDREVSMRRSGRGGWGARRPISTSVSAHSGTWGSSDNLLASSPATARHTLTGSSGVLHRVASDRSRSQSGERGRVMAPPAESKVPRKARQDSPKKKKGMPEDIPTVPFV